MRPTKRFLTALGFGLGLVAIGRAQTTPPEAPAGGAPAPAASAGSPAAEAVNKRVIEDIKREDELVMSGRGGYSYEPAGRRDPFVNPMEAQKGPGDDGAGPRPDGSAGMLINEVSLQGVTIYGGDPIAVMMGTDAVGYFLREGDELWDGKIIAVDFEEGKVVFQQKVEDRSSPIRFREVVKKLNP